MPCKPLFTRGADGRIISVYDFDDEDLTDAQLSTLLTSAEQDAEHLWAHGQDVSAALMRKLCAQLRKRLGA